MGAISIHTYNLAKYAFFQLSSLRHSNGGKVVQIYSETAYDDMRLREEF